MTERAPARKRQAKERGGGASAAPLRILHVITGLGPGGAETVLFRLTGQLRNLQHEVICLGPRDWYSEQFEQRGIRVHHVDCSTVRTAAANALRLHRLIKSSDADLVQAWMYRGNVFGGIASRIAGKPVLWNIRCSTFELNPFASRMLARLGGILARWIPELVLNCSSLSRQLHARIGYDAAEGEVIPNGYDPDDFHPDEKERAVTRESLGISPDCFLAGTVGRWDPQKGYPVLLRAIALVRDRGIPMRVLLVGGGLDWGNGELAEIIRANGCSEVVQPIGHRPDVAKIDRALDLHVLPSLTEGFPNVVAETMLSGTPNVSTDVGDAKLIVGETGWIVPPGDAEQLADAIERAYSEWKSSPEKWGQRRIAARHRIVDNFSLEGMAQAYENAWSRVARKTAARTAASRLPPEPVARRRTARKPLRVLHIINNLGLGGAETLLYRLVTRDSENEHIVVSLGPKDWYSSRVPVDRVALHHLDMDSPSSVVNGLFQLRRIVRESGADVVQCWMYRSNVLGGLIAKAAGKRVVWGIHNASVEPLKPSSRALVRLGGYLAPSNPDFIINCSNSSMRVHERLGYSAAKTAVVHNGYDSSVFHPDEAARATTREALGIGPGEFAIGSVSRWDPLKDVPNLLAAMRIVNERGTAVRCFLIGAHLDAENSDLVRAIERAGCREFVVPLGARSDIQNVSRALDLHVLSSVTESCPNVVAETMLSGVPNAVTDVGDSAVLVGDSGWIVPPHDPGALAEAIIEGHREWKERPNDWAARRIAAREQIADHFSFDRMSIAYHEIWARIAGQRAA